jgi:DNA-binding LytR/AlgR family response regulator
MASKSTFVNVVQAGSYTIWVVSQEWFPATIARTRRATTVFALVLTSTMSPNGVQNDHILGPRCEAVEEEESVRHLEQIQRSYLVTGVL